MIDSPRYRYAFGSMFLRWLKRCRRRIRNRIDAQPAGIKPEPTIRLTGGYRHLGPDVTEHDRTSEAMDRAVPLLGVFVAGVILCGIAINVWLALR